MSKNTVNKITKKIVCGNWKMNPRSSVEAEKLFLEIIKELPSIKKTDVVICPPFLYLEKFRKISKKITLGAQDAFIGNIGAYTGEISPEMLCSIGCKYVILGHSERRTLGENNNDINKKIKSTLSSGLVPVVCVGENMRDENHEYLNFIKTQIEESLDKVSRNSISKIVIAYEPVWAIGKGALPATPEEFREMNIFIRKVLSDKFGVKDIKNIRIIYGGSVDEKNTEEFIKNGHADGFLLGRASLDPKKFSKIIKICEALNK
ncbi:MAG: Triosephosphate isomerase [Candidatus Nomurabacteria bacterium GW2011_GWE1_32_28]|uniref:Triosephosphate isomerase n=1 Tax=Candidatus Nomurabacteria bacterium GW2011_GWF1_31_48 TaxID=1618767 RepID=A0A0F9YU53_9BACT|nr:MAG: Triosephosphate isomerase [Candidatus Nomurabacteria bacterium GW2011_GWF2_30_133]KKP28426.1 MAG: Triosephosphate isomerase [Candidatus Nomurabacteria bacterium GW2011_GWE2_31_40]KKP30006.1 MAG: Triosephosphate isomerase [Candidatus Nomurabacteria bacterium GW2011_GWF1_31_48]KKP34525.1 MAG: Triosephosphate isomerase [Candidatus Nomurabacteria bacterium GW2011_GWE1_32_28]HAS81076.1 triose-phosphate isomerase [Candidatus Nomurabacteria bacterium]